MEAPETRYAKTSEGHHVAYQVTGHGGLDLVLMPQPAGHIEMAWDVPGFAHVLERLASFGRLIRFDHRGTGMSDARGASERPVLEERANDILAVLDAVDSGRAAIVANGPGGLTAIFFAASYPSRTSALVLDGCYARLERAPDYPWGVPTAFLRETVGAVRPTSLGGDGGIAYLAPHAMLDADFVAVWRRYTRYSGSPATSLSDAEMVVFSDVRPVLGSIQAPTLVLYRSGDRFAGQPHARYLAEHIAGAKLVELPGEDNLIVVGDSDADLDEIEEFLTGARHVPETDRVLATVLFTDVVGSTETAVQMGDRRWHDLLDRHDQLVKRQVERFRGRMVKHTGDGVLASFDGPGRAIQCACAIRDAVTSLDIQVRVGLHTGEVEMRGSDLAGIAVHLAQRVSALAGPGEVLVSRTVVDLVAGSGLEFEGRGEHELKGVPGTWALFSVGS